MALCDSLGITMDTYRQAARPEVPTSELFVKLVIPFLSHLSHLIPCLHLRSKKSAGRMLEAGPDKAAPFLGQNGNFPP